MKIKIKILLSFLLMTNLSLATAMPTETSLPTRPNIIFIFADDLGYGDLGLFGSEKIKTPNIDRLGAEGIKFSEFYAASPICSPSRAALLTGRYPFRQGINNVFFHHSVTGMAQEEITIAEVLKQGGYRTGLIGKWHLGHLDRYMPWNQGFDEYFGVPHSNDMGNFFYYRNKEILIEEIDQRYMTQNYTKEAIDFIKANASQPFFLYIAHSMPHTPIYASPEFEGKSQGGLYGDVVEEMDWSVGEIVQTIEGLGLAENTLVVFTSDNGPWLMMGKDGGSPGILKEGKATTFEGGMRVPAVAYWKNVIAPGTQYNDIATMMDWLPTFLTITQLQLPEARQLDGHDISQVLIGKGTRAERKLLYHMKSQLDETGPGEFRAYRSGDWKIKTEYKTNIFMSMLAWIHPGIVGSHEVMLINLKDDPSEKNNLADQMPDKLASMQTEMQTYIDSLGELPASLPVNGKMADYSAFIELGLYVVLKVTGIMALLILGFVLIKRKVLV